MIDVSQRGTTFVAQVAAGALMVATIVTACAPARPPVATPGEAESGNPPPSASSPPPVAPPPAASAGGESDGTPLALSGTGTSTTVRTHEPGSPAEQGEHQDGCKKGDAVACHAAALDAYYTPSNPTTDRTAFDLFKKACDLGYAASCNGLGALYAEGRGAAKDPVKAAQLFRDSCVAGASTGCEHLSEALHRGVGVTTDEAASVRAKARGKCAFEASLKKKSLASCPAL